MSSIATASWSIASLADVCEINPRLNRTGIDAGLEVSFVPMAAVEAETGKIDVSARRAFAAVRKGFTAFKRNDVLFAKITPCMENGKVAVVPAVQSDLGFGSTEFHVLRPQQGIDPKYIYFYVASRQFRADAEHNMTGAVGQRRVPTTYLSQATLPVPPSNEQLRIVAKIEELFSELDKGIENLKLARSQLAVYRQALLKHAFEGKLTADWRDVHADQLEPSEQLLNGIRTKHALSKFVSMRQKDLADLPPIPTCWSYTYLANTGELNRGKSKHRPRNDPALFGGPYPFIQTGEVKAAEGVIRAFENTYSEAGLKQSKLWPKGTLCITIAANIAETAFLGIDACFPDSVVGFSAYHGIVEPKYVDLFIRGVRTRIEAYAPATAQKNINLATLEGLVMPVASLAEQKELVARLSAQLSVLDQIQSEIDANLQKSEALRQSILKKAFAGELVPQDPNDEPAAALLARIRAERASIKASSDAAPKTKARKSKAAKA